MNPEVKAKWVQALRSGDYEQGRGVLRTSDNKFCCLGVLCDLAMKEGVVPPWDVNSYGDNAALGESGMRHSHLPPPKVEVWAGVEARPEWDSPWGFLDLTGEAVTLFGMNDDGASFAEIADAIEEEL